MLILTVLKLICLQIFAYKAFLNRKQSISFDKNKVVENLIWITLRSDLWLNL